MINNVVLVGRITRDVELRMSDSGKAYTNFSLAVNRAFKGQDGKQQADFINCIVFGKQILWKRKYDRSFRKYSNRKVSR